MATLHYIVLSLTFIVWTRACKDKFECFSKARRGRFVNGDVLKERNVIRFSDCLGDCGRHSDCKALNYNKFTGKCELMDNHYQRADEISLDSDDKHFINSVAPTTPKPQVCVEKSCGHGEVCYEYKQRNRVCLPECGETPIPSGGSGITYVFNDVGQKRTTNCPVEQTNVGNTERTCLSNKAWTPLECLEVCHFWLDCSSWIDDERFSERYFTKMNADYLLFNGKDVSLGEKAAIHTAITIPANEQVCLSFDYSIIGNSKMGALYVKTLIGRNSVLTDEVMVTDGSQVLDWSPYTKTFSPKSKNYKIYIMAVRDLDGDDFQIEIDDVKLEYCASNSDSFRQSEME